MALTEEQTQRYARHIALKEVGAAGQQRLLEAKVLVVGAGALGSAALLYLAGAGVGTLGIMDDDRVERSNLQRQILYGTKDLGREKVAAAAAAVRERNPEITLRQHREKLTPDNAQRVLADYDLALDCTDRFETKFLLNDACVLARKPYVHAGVVRFGGQVMTYVPGRGPCLRCLLGEVPPNTVTGAGAGVLGAAAGVIGSCQALEAVKCLLGVGDLLTGRVLTFDGLTMAVRVSRVPGADPDCAVCGSHPAIDDLRANRREYEPEAVPPGAAHTTEDTKRKD